MGSPYVPLDSWVYPAMERLAAFGYIKTASLGIRPWTRMECARLVGEAAELAPDIDGPPEVQELFRLSLGRIRGRIWTDEWREAMYTRRWNLFINERWEFPERR